MMKIHNSWIERCLDWLNGIQQRYLHRRARRSASTDVYHRLRQPLQQPLRTAARRGRHCRCQEDAIYRKGRQYLVDSFTQNIDRSTLTTSTITTNDNKDIDNPNVHRECEWQPFIKQQCISRVLVVSTALIILINQCVFMCSLYSPPIINDYFIFFHTK